MKTNQAVEKTKETLKDQAYQTGNHFKDNLYAIKSTLIKTMTDAEKKLGKSVKNMKGRSKGIQRSAIGTVKRHPVKSVGVAALIGLVVSQVFNIRRIL